ncbi:MAG TPA: hypothetical protein VFF55_07565, partial [Candidatus Deferrimicrobium sp.]|nr:hypothetical protein [Candidatus Deferrimicrobium sp.]
MTANVSRPTGAQRRSWLARSATLALSLSLSLALLPLAPTGLASAQDASSLATSGEAASLPEGFNARMVRQ